MSRRVGQRISSRTKMNNARSLRLLFTITFSIESCITDAWTLLPSRTTDFKTRRIRKSHRRPGFSCNNLVSVRSDFGCTLLHTSSDGEDGTDLEEEEFYKQYESMYTPNAAASDNNGKGDGNILDSEKSQSSINNNNNIQPQELQDGVRSTTPPNNRKVKLAKAWDESLLQQMVVDSGKAEIDSDGRTTVSNLSDLQQKLQQIQKRNQKGPVRGYSSGEQNNDSIATPEHDGSASDARRQESEIAEEGYKFDDRFRNILEKAQGRLSEMTDSDDKSDIKNDENRSMMDSKMSSLQKRIQQPLEPKYFNDETLAEWVDLDNQLQKEAAENASKKKQSPPPSILEETNKEVLPPDEAAILDALRSQAAAANTLDNDTRGSETINNLDDQDLTANEIPSDYKKFVTDYEFTNDGGVFLSPEAYQEACNNANSDGSLNFAGGEIDNGSDSQRQSSSLESAIVGDEPPMAPYGGEQGRGDAASRKQVSIEDLTQQASRSLEFVRNNPEAQETLHRRLMAEFEVEESTQDELENDALLDPEKARAFLNREYFEQQKQEARALEDLLDQKMQKLKEEEETKKNKISNINREPHDNGGEGQPERTGETRKAMSAGQENIFFASRTERIDRKRTMERNRRQRAKDIAKFYEGLGENSSWDSTSESIEFKAMSNDGEIPQNDFMASREEKNSSENSPSTEIQENTQRKIPKNDNREISPETDERGNDESEWVFVEDPESPDDAFYWNEGTNEMRWEPPEKW